MLTVKVTTTSPVAESTPRSAVLPLAYLALISVRSIPGTYSRYERIVMLFTDLAGTY